MDEHQEDSPGIDWDKEFKDMMRNDPVEAVRYVEGRLSLYVNPIGFEFQFAEEGQETRGYIVTDIQAANLALTIMAIIGNR